MTVTNPSTAAADADLAAIDARWRTLFRGQVNCRASSITGAGQLFVGSSDLPFDAIAASAFIKLWSVEAAAIDLPGRVTQLRMVANCGVNDTAPGRDVTISLCRGGAPSGGVNVFNPNAVVVAASAITFTAPGPNTDPSEVPTAPFALPGDDRYSIGIQATGAFATNSFVVISFRLEARGV